MKTIPAVWLLCTAVLAVLSTAVAQETYTLRLLMEPGKAYLYDDVARTAMTQEMAGQEMKINTAVTMISRASVQARETDGSLVIITSLDSLVVASKSPRRDTTMVMTDMIGKRNKVVLSPVGKVLAREVIDSVTSPGSMARGAAMREVVRYHQLPEEPVAVGAKWTKSVVDSNEGMGGKIVSTATVEYQLAGVEEKAGHACLRITYAGDMTIEGKGAMMGMEIFTEGRGTTSGTWFFDPKGGYTVAEDARIETDMTAAMTGQQTMTIPITQSTTVTRMLRGIEEAAR